MIPSSPKSSDSAIDEILAVLKSARTVCLSGHQNPDADVIGSELAMASLIRRMGGNQSIDIINSGAPPESLKFLPGFDQIQDREKSDKFYDVCVVFECSGTDRMGNLLDLKKQVKTVINLDHHLHTPNYGHINIVEPTTSSTAELVFKIFERSGFALSETEAMCLFSGLVTDTGWFRFGNTNPQSLRIAASLLDAGVKAEDLAERIYMSRTKAAMDLLGYALNHMVLHHDNRVALLEIPEELFKSLKATPDDIEEIVNYGLKINTVCASILLKEKKSLNQVKVSLRSKGVWDVNQVACSFGGGGHKNASGCTIEGPLERVRAQILDAVQVVFK